ncbi:LacI family transcriptional regulator [Erwinia endophytica]|uniref:LacI family DNA-binding transcriptional regulator n=1 Tax=Erwinia endophytica TaxID=1563158 RepID=UPI001265DD2F|nr:LacI family DNA-binding transcriptional regulator [Erwinia endophytica]KAB8313722.1 LacI family transcriptional regulator [Erwinia endophytica]
MKKLTLQMLAKMAGVGVATVDRVLNERGGVSPDTVRKVLQVAREAGLKRPLPEAYQHPWRIEVFLSSTPSHFFKRLASEFSRIASQLGYQRLTLYRTFVAESQPEILAQRIIESGEQRDGLIIFGHDYPIIHQALAHCWARRVPVITIATDIPQAQRLCHVGINQYQAGRTAGLLMSKTLKRAGDVILVSGRIDYRAHRQRIEGFREAMSQRSPEIKIREALAGQDQRETIRHLLQSTLTFSHDVAGIYNSGVGNGEIQEILQQHQLLGKCTWITHELYSVTEKMLHQDCVAFTLDQNADQHVRLSIELMLRHLESGYQPELYSDGKVPLKIITAENLD